MQCCPDETGDCIPFLVVTSTLSDSIVEIREPLMLRGGKVHKHPNHLYGVEYQMIVTELGHRLFDR